MKEREDVTVAEKYTFDGANTITLKKRKHKGHTQEWHHRGYCNIVLR